MHACAEDVAEEEGGGEVGGRGVEGRMFEEEESC